MLQPFTFLSVLLGLLTSNQSNATNEGGESGGDAGGAFDPNG